MPIIDSGIVQIINNDAQKVRETRMMRFIFALPVGDVTLLPEDDRFCILCNERYNLAWNINERERAVVLPCGDFVGSICIRTWLSPFEDACTTCPFPDCGLQFPCPVNGMHCHEQTIVRGKLRPITRVRYPTNATVKDGETLVDIGRGSEEDEDCENSEWGSVATEEIIGAVADGANIGNIENEDPTPQVANHLLHLREESWQAENKKAPASGRPSLNRNEEHEDVAAIDSEEHLHAEIAEAEAEASEVRAFSRWSMVREALQRIAQPRIDGRGKKWSYS